jgi:hypothetical protein
MSRGGSRMLKSARKSTIFLTALSIAAAVSAILVLFGGPAPPMADTQSAVFGHNGLSSHTTRPQPSALFIGDSYTMGYSEGPAPDSSYACLTAINMGWQCSVVAQVGTGYINGGPGRRLHRAMGIRNADSTSLWERFPRLRELYRADIVVLDGGRADVQFDISDVRTMFEYTVRQAMQFWPNSRIVVIAPWLISQPAIRPPSLSGRPIGQELGSILRSSPDFDAVTFIDPAALNWFADVDTSTYTADDGVIPNSAGDQKIAELLTAALIQHGLANVT